MERMVLRTHRAQVLVPMLFYALATVLGLQWGEGAVLEAQESTETTAHGADVEARADALEQRLMGPCCYKQTMDAHDSELVTALRREIRARLAGGESTQEIQDDMVKRFGERVLAVPPRSPLERSALYVIAALLGAGALLWWRARAWARPHAPEEAPKELVPDAEYDAAVDRALEAMD